jgi:hypothetical protein
MKMRNELARKGLGGVQRLGQRDLADRAVRAVLGEPGAASGIGVGARPRAAGVGTAYSLSVPAVLMRPTLPFAGPVNRGEPSGAAAKLWRLASIARRESAVSGGDVISGSPHRLLQCGMPCDAVCWGLSGLAEARTGHGRREGFRRGTLRRAVRTAEVVR